MITVWIRLGKRDNGTAYYEDVIIYIDDYMYTLEHPDNVLDNIGRYFTLKPGSVGSSKICLSGKMAR